MVQLNFFGRALVLFSTVLLQDTAVVTSFCFESSHDRFKFSSRIHTPQNNPHQHFKFIPSFSSFLLSTSNEHNHDDSRSMMRNNDGVRFLGQGPNAIVREGVVLIAPQHEYHHYYRRSSIFVYGIGDDDEGVCVIRGVIVDHPTPFTLHEMIPTKFNNDHPLGQSLLFRGGDKGGDGVVLLHNQAKFGTPPIGTSGVYQGGWDMAMAAIEAKEADVTDFKAFFNYCEFTEEELEELLESQEDGDGWASVEVGSDIILSDAWDRGDCWKRLRNAITQIQN